MRHTFGARPRSPNNLLLLRSDGSRLELLPPRAIMAAIEKSVPLLPVFDATSAAAAAAAAAATVAAPACVCVPSNMFFLFCFFLLPPEFQTPQFFTIHFCTTRRVNRRELNIFLYLFPNLQLNTRTNNHLSVCFLLQTATNSIEHSKASPIETEPLDSAKANRFNTSASHFPFGEL